MRINYSILLFIIVLCFSCSNEKAPVIGVKTIDLVESTDVLPISSFIKELDYLELRASDANIEIGEIQDIKILSGDIIIKQRKAAEMSFIRFSKSGEFISEIVNNKNGKVSNPLDIIEYRKNYAVLADDGIHQISKMGQYKGKVISTKISGRTFLNHKNNFLLINEIPSSEFLSEYSSKRKPKVIDKPNERINKWVYTDLATPSKNEYHLISSFCDTIYFYKNGRLEPRYRLDGGLYPTLSEVWQNVGDRDPKETMRYIYDTQHVLVRNYLENEDVIFMTYWVGSNSTTLIIKKENWETRYYAREVNDIDGGIWDKPLCLSSNDELYIPISSYKIKGHKISNKRHNDFEQLQEKMVDNGNPVIMRCRLK